MTLEELVLECNRAAASAAPGTRPFFVLEVDGDQRRLGRRLKIPFSSFTLDGKILGARNAEPDKTKPAQWKTGARFFVDEVNRVLERAGLVTVHRVRPGQAMPDEAASRVLAQHLEPAMEEDDGPSPTVECQRCHTQIPRIFEHARHQLGSSTDFCEPTKTEAA